MVPDWGAWEMAGMLCDCEAAVCGERLVRGDAGSNGSHLWTRPLTPKLDLTPAHFHSKSSKSGDLEPTSLSSPCSEISLLSLGMLPSSRDPPSPCPSWLQAAWPHLPGSPVWVWAGRMNMQGWWWALLAPAEAPAHCWHLAGTCRHSPCWDLGGESRGWSKHLGLSPTPQAEVPNVPVPVTGMAV